MKCPYCPKEIREDRTYKRTIGGNVCESNPDSSTEGLSKAMQMIENGEYVQSVNLDEFSEQNIMNKVLESYTRYCIYIANTYE